MTSIGDQFYELKLKDGDTTRMPNIAFLFFLLSRGQPPASNFVGRLEQLNAYREYIGKKPDAVDWTMEDGE